MMIDVPVDGRDEPIRLTSLKNCTWMMYDEDSTVTVWVHPERRRPPSRAIRRYDVTVQVGSTLLPGTADVAFTGDETQDLRECRVAAQLLLDRFRTDLSAARIPLETRYTEDDETSPA